MVRWLVDRFYGSYEVCIAESGEALRELEHDCKRALLVDSPGRRVFRGQGLKPCVAAGQRKRERERKRARVEASGSDDDMAIRVRAI